MLERWKSGQFQKSNYYAAIAVIITTGSLFLIVIALRCTVADSFSSGTFIYKILNSIFAFDQWRTYLPFFITITIIIGYLFCLRFRTFSCFLPGALLVMTVLELGAMGWGYNPTVAESEILPIAPAVELLKMRQQEPYRILTTDGYFYPNYGAAYGIDDVAGYDAPVYQSFSNIYVAQGGASIGGQIDSRQQWDPNWPLVDFLNVRYVVSPRDLPLDKFKMIFENKYFAIYENLQVFPRAFMVYNSEVMPNRKAMLDKMISKQIDFSRKVLLDEAIRPEVTTVSGAIKKFTVRQVKYSTDQAVLEVNTENPGILVMSDLYTPDWSASIDGSEVKLYRANYAYRAVTVPAGQHTVIFRYSPRSYKIGVIMTLCGMTALLMIICRQLFFKLQKSYLK